VSAPLEKLRAAAKQMAAVAGDLEASKLDATIAVADRRYFIRVEKIVKRIGRGKTAREELDRVQVTMRENSNQGDIILASPLEWL
jgi:hypothetical protein